MADTLAQRVCVIVRLIYLARGKRRSTCSLPCCLSRIPAYSWWRTREEDGMGGKRYPSGKQKKGRKKEEEAEERSNRLVMARSLRLSKYVDGGKRQATTRSCCSRYHALC